MDTKTFNGEQKIKLTQLINEGMQVMHEVETLNGGLADTIKAIAEELEHITSKVLIERLDNFLGNPKFDPHGDPIPDSNGKMQTQPQINLVDMPIGETASVSAVGSQSTELLELLTHKNIAIGTQITIKKKFSFDHSMEIETPANSSFTISRELALALFVTLKTPSLL
jgi:DtxR family Mn-dependent transcriptional regulator